MSTAEPEFRHPNARARPRVYGARPKWGAVGGEWSVPSAHVPDALDVAEIRRAERITQAAFAKRYGFSEAAVRDWEQGRRRPGVTARIVLLMIRDEPDAVRRVLAPSKRKRGRLRERAKSYAKALANDILR